MNNNSNSKTTLALTIIFAICATIGLGLSIFNSIQISQINQTLSSTEPDYSALSDDDLLFNEEENLTCTLPTNASDIDYLFLGYNKGDNQIFVDSEGEIGYFDLDNDQTLNIDTSDIMQQIFNSDLSSFTDYNDDAFDEDDNVEWNWLIEMYVGEDSACQAGGQDTPPTWFNDLVDLINSKK